MMFVVVSLACWVSPQSSATSIVPLTWEELVLGSDFVGVVECIQAGGIAARYRVVESWLGPAKGTEMLVVTEPDPMGNCFPTLLAGQQWLMTAIRVGGYSSVPFTQERHDFPLSWRRIRPDYVLPTFQGKWKIDGSPYMAEDLSETFGDDVRTLDQVRMKVSELFFANEPELLILRHQALRILRDDAPRNLSRSPTSEESLVQIAEAKTVERLLEALFKISLQGEEGRAILNSILTLGGRQKTLSLLESMPAKESPLGSDNHSAAINSLRRRLSDPKGVVISQAYDAEPPVSPEKIDEARKTFRENDWEPVEGELPRMSHKPAPNEWSTKRWRVVDLLTRHDPALVVDALSVWESLSPKGEVNEEGYSVGSAFCFRCGKERVELFTKLLKAKDPYVRVAAAVYLCFEDKQAGLRELREFSQLPGIPGDWAAVVRLERGDKDAMPRALTILDPELHKDQTAYVYSPVFTAMRDRLWIVLSNTAYHHHIKLPQIDMAENVEDEDAAAVAYFRDLRDWWKNNQDKVELQNPWAQALEAQKVD